MKRSAILFLFSLSLMGQSVYAQNPRPFVSGYSAPFNGKPGTQFDISGNNFSYTLSDNIVFVGGMRAPVNTSSIGSISSTVPYGTRYGPIKVTTLLHKQGWSELPFVPTFTGGDLEASSFAPKTDITHNAKVGAINVADLDGDGKPDLIFGNYTGVVLNIFEEYFVSVYRNTTSGGSPPSFAPRVNVTAGKGVIRIYLEDMNGDGKLDIITVNELEPNAPVSIMLNNSTPGTISFGSPINFNANIETNNQTIRVRDIVIGDVDGDGYLDMGFIYTAQYFRVYKNSENFGWSMPFEDNSQGIPSSVLFMDLNSDGKPEVIISRQLAVEPLRILQNNSIAGTVSLAATSPLGYAGVQPEYLYKGDFDRDGRVDLLVTEGVTGSMYFYRRNASAYGFDPPVAVGSGNERFVDVGDIDGDGKPDVVIRYYDGSYWMRVIRNQSTSGTISFGSPVNYPANEGANMMNIGDLNADGRPDVVVQHAFTSDTKVSIFRNTLLTHSLSKTLVVVSDDTVKSGNTVNVTLQLKDNNGNPIFLGGTTVVFSATGGGTSTGTFSPVQSNGSGTYTTTFRGVIAGTPKAVTAMLNGRAVTSTLPTVRVIPGDISALQSPITISSPIVVKNGTVSVSLRAKDVNGNNIPTGGASVGFFLSGPGTSGGSFSPVTDFNNGLYGATFTGTTEGTTKTVTALVDGIPFFTLVPTVTVQSNVPSASNAVITIAPQTIQSGTSATVKIQLRNSSGTPLVEGGHTVGFVFTGGGTSAGIFGPTTDNHDGTYTTTLVATISGSAGQVGGTVNGNALTNLTNNTFTVTPGAFSNAGSTITISPNPLPSGTTAIATFQARDAAGNPIAQTNLTVELTLQSVITGGGTSTGVFEPVVNHGDGSYTATFKGLTAGSPTRLDVNTIGVPGAGLKNNGEPFVTVTPGAVSLSQSVLTLGQPSISSGLATIITLQAKDSVGNNQTSGGLAVAFAMQGGGTSDGTIGSVIDHGNGTYSATFTATTVGSARTIAATIGGNPLASALPTITVTVGRPTIAALSLYSGAPGGSLAITGTNFGQTIGENAVFFGTIPASITAASSTSLSVSIPPSSMYGPVTVFNLASGLTGVSALPFQATFDAGGFIDHTALSSRIDIASGTPTTAVAVGDVDGDGKPDVVASNKNNATLTLWRNTGTPGSVSFAAPSILGAMNLVESIQMADLDGDGKLDIAAANSSNLTLSAFRNTSSLGSMTFAPRQDFWLRTDNLGGGVVNGVNSLAVADFNGDGKLDLATIDGSNKLAIILLNRSVPGAISFTTNFDLVAGPSVHGVASGDLDGDGKPELLISYDTPGTVDIYRNTSVAGILSFAPKVNFAAGSGSYGMAIEDVDGDGKPELLVANRLGSGSVSILRNTSSIGSLSFAPKQEFTADDGTSSIAVGDIDGDGKPDLAVANTNSATISLLKNLSIPGTLGFQPPRNFSTGSIVGNIVLGDLDQDGKPDLAIARQNANFFSAFRGRVAQYSPTQSIIALSADSVQSGAPVTVTLQLKESNGTNLALGGQAVIFSLKGSGTSTGTFASTVDHGDGTYSALFTGITVGTPTQVSVTINGTTLVSTLPEVKVIPGSVSPLTSFVQPLVSPGFGILFIQSGSSVTVTVRARDAAGNNHVQGGQTVVLYHKGDGTSTGNVGSTIDNGDGTYQASFTGITAGTVDSIGAIINGDTLTTKKVSFIVRHGVASADHSLLTVVHDTIQAGTEGNIVLFVRDANGNPVTAGYDVVDFGLAGGTSDGLIRVDDYGRAAHGPNGDYYGRLYGMNAGTPRTITARVNGANVTTPLPTMTVASGQISTSRSFTEVSSSLVASGGTATVTLNARDIFFNPHTQGDLNVSFLYGGGGTSTGTFGPTTYIGDGKYISTFTGGQTGTLKYVVASINGTQVSTYLPWILVEPGAYSPTLSTLSVLNPVIQAGKSTYITFQSKDASGNNLFSGGLNVQMWVDSSGSSRGIREGVYDLQNGQYRLYFEGRTAGTPDTVRVTVNGVELQIPRPTLTVVPGQISPGSSQVIVGSSPIRVGEATPVTLIARDDYGNRLITGGLTASYTLESFPWSGTSNGTFSAVVDSNNGAYTSFFTGTLAGSSRLISTTTNVTPLNPRPEITVQGSPVLTAFSPASGNTGTTVTLQGTNFNSTPANNIVHFGATKATVTAGTTTSLTVTVPAAATYAPVTLADPSKNGVSISWAFFAPTFAGGDIFSSSSMHPKQDFALGANAKALAAVDLDGDGKPDLIASNTDDNSISVYRNTGSSGTITFAARQDIVSGAAPHSVKVGDFDSDGMKDLAFVNGGGASFSILKNTSSSGAISFASSVDISTPANLKTLTLNDFDADGGLDVAVAFATEVRVYRGLGSMNFAQPVVLSVTNSLEELTAGDLTGDRKPEIAAVSSGANLLTVYHNTSSPGALSFSGGVGLATGVFPSAVAVGDLNHDGAIDIVVSNATSNTISYFRNTSSGGGLSLQSKVDVPTGGGPAGISIGEMNGDGKLDLVVTNSGDASVSVFLSVGTGSFSLAPPATFTTGTGPASVIVADLDGDARFDLATANSTANSISVLRSRIDQFSLTRSVVSSSQTSVTSGSSITVTLQAKDINGSNVTTGGATVAFFTTGPGTSTVTFGSVTDNNNGTYSATATGVIAGTSVSIGASVNGAVVTSSLPAVSVLPGPAVAATASIFGGFTIGINEQADVYLHARDANGNLVTIGGAAVVFSLTGGGTSSGTFGSVIDHGNGTYSASFTATVAGSARTISATFNGTTIGTSLPDVQVVINPPVINSLGATSGVAGSSVVITGSGFDPNPSLNDVYFGPAKAIVTAATSTSLTVVVPAGAVYGPVTVIANGFSDQSHQHFSKPFASADSIASFTATSTVSAGNTPRGIVTGDFNEDGKIDIAVANFGSSTITVALGNGDGTFTGGATLSVGSNTSFLTAGYYNQDAHLDIASASAGGNVIQYALGNGDGTFASMVSAGAGTAPIGIASGDLNNDGKMDLVTTGLLNNTVVPLLNFGGSPIFSALPTSSTGSFPQNAILGDFNSDGFLDVVVPSGNDNNFTLRLGVGNGTFSGGSSFGNGGLYAAKGDFNNDGNLDVVTTGSALSIHLGNGGGGFGFSNSFGASGSLIQSAVADFNGDGMLDIAVARNALSSVAIYTGNGNGTFGAGFAVTVGSGPYGLATADVNADGKPDLIVSNSGSNNASVLLNTTASAPAFTLSATVLSAGFVPVFEPKEDVVTVTNNGLTTLTISSVTSSNPEFSVVPTNLSLPAGYSQEFTITATPTSAGAKSANIIFTHTVSGSPDTVQVTATAVVLPPVLSSFSPKLAAVGASVTLAGSHFDPVTTNNLVYFGGVKAAVVSASTSQLVVSVPPGVTYERLFVTKNGFAVGSKDFFTMRFTISSPGVSFAPSLINTGISGNVSQGAAVGDFNNDGSLDLVVSGAADKSLSVLLGNGAGSFGAASILAMAGTANKVIAADVDTDGKVDILASSGDSIVVFRGNGNGTFASPLYTFAGTATGNLAVADFNNDGVLDVVVACTGENRAAVLPGNGNGTFGARTLLANGGALKSVVAADFNSDGKMDVAVTSAANLASPSVFLGNGNGTFGSAINHSIPFHFGGGYDIVAGDFNRDGMMDLAEITVDFLSVVTIYSGNGDGTTFLQTYQVMTAPSHALTTSDFNGDGLLDLLTVHTNSGGGDLSVILGQGNGFFNNAISVGTVTGGQDLITGDFNNDGKADIVSANSTAASGNTAKLLLNGIVLPSGAPVLVSPANGGTVPVTPTLSWNAVSGASTYKVEVATDSTFSSLVFTNAAVASTSLVTGQLSGNTQYYWRVTPIGNSGAIGNASLKRHFATGLSVPVPAFPGGGNALSFNGTDGYVSIPDQPSFRLTDNFTLEAWVYAAGSGNMTILDKGNYNYLFSLRPNGTTGLGFFTVNTGWVYSGGTVPLNQWSHVAVVVQSGTGGVKFYLDGVLLGTATLPAAVVTNNGEINIGRQAPGNCNCNFFHGQLDEVRIWNVARTDGDIQSSHNRLLGPGSGLVANYRFDEGTGILASDATGNGNTGTLVNGTSWIGSGAPIQTVVPTTTTLQWSVVPNADSYGVQVSTVANFASTNLNQTNIGSNSYAISGLSAGTTYYWRVKAAKPNDTTAYSVVSSFNTIPPAPGSAPSLATPADGAVNQQVSLTLGWGSAAGANAYRLQLATDNTFNAVTYDQANIGSTSHAPSGLLNNTTYYWRVSAGNEGGYSSFSSSRSFTTLPDVPASPALSVPIAGATNQSTGFSISWNTVSGASHYGLQIATDSLFTAMTVNQDSLVGTSAVISGLANNSVYYWRVRGINVAGYGPFSSPRQFETISNIPAAPGLVAPAHAALNIPLATTLSWNAVSAANSYSVQVSTDSLFSTTVADLQGISLTTFDLQGLSPDSIYYWRVRGTGVGGAGAYSTTRSFATIPASPSAPILALPADGDINRPMALAVIWNNRSGALTYHLEFSSDGTFATHLIDSIGIADTTFTLTGLSQNTTYYWRISGENAGGTGPASPIRSFTTLPPPPGAPVLALPSDGGVHQPTTPILSWNSTLLAGTYRLLLSTDSTFATSLHDQSGLTDTTFVGTGLSLGTRYFWKVSSTNAGGTGPFSVTRSFTTLPVVPAVPVLATPVHASTDQALSLSVTWNVVPGADSYHVQVSADSLFSTFVADQSGIAVTSLALNGLTTSTSYYWRVNATNVSGTSAYSLIRSFTTVPPASATPTLAIPANQAFDILLSPTLSWNAALGAITYRLQVSTDSTFASTAFDQAAIAGTSQAVSGLVAGAVYYWRVRATNTGGESPFTAHREFTTVPPIPAAPALALPTDAATNQSRNVTLSWNASAGAISYRIQISTDNTFATSLVDSSGITGASFTTSDLAANTTYHWKVSASNPGGSSPFSPIRQFGTVPPVPATPVLSSPTNSAANVPTSLLLVWGAASGANAYHLQVASDAAFSSLFVDTSGLSSTVFLLENLQPDTLYFWRVSAVNIGGANISSVRAFSTVALPPSAPLVVAPVNGSIDQLLGVTLAWGPVAGATSYRLQFSTDDAFTTLLVDSTGIDSSHCSLSGLLRNTTYFWRVSALNSGGAGLYSDIASFTTIPPPPPVPTLVFPFDLSGNAPTSMTFSWFKESQATSYRFQLAPDSSFVAPITDQSNIPDTSVTIHTLTYSTVYYWRVSAHNSGGASLFTAARKLTTTAAPPPPPPPPVVPAIPTLLSPGHGAAQQQIVLSVQWSSVPTATLYRLQVATDSSFSSSLIDRDSLVATSDSISGLAYNTTYFWRVRAGNAVGFSLYSAANAFSTMPAFVAVPELLLPPDDAKDVAISMALHWNKADSASFYRLQVASDTLFASLVVDADSIFSTSKEITGLTHATTYWWRVQAKTHGGTSAFSPRWGFTTIVTLPVPPELSSPEDNAINQPTTVALSWNAVAGAQVYHAQAASDSLFSSVVADADSLDETSFMLGGLSLNTGYFWRVRAKNEAGPGPFSEIRRFRTVLTTSVEVIAEDVPRVFALSQNYPNPFNPVTRIEFSLPEAGRVSLRVFDAIGRQVAVLFDDEGEAGRRYRATFNGAQLPSGMYFARLQSDGKQLIRKVLLVK